MLTELLNLYCLSQAIVTYLNISRLRNELNNNHETVDNRIVDKSVSSGTSTEHIANIDTKWVLRRFYTADLIVRLS